MCLLFFVNFFQCCAVELVLEKERESFWLATVEPALRLKDELNFRASQLRQQKVTVGGSDLEQVLQKVFLWYRIKTSQTVCNRHRHRGACHMPTPLNISRKNMRFLSQTVLPKPLNKESPARLSRFLNAPARLTEEFWSPPCSALTAVPACTPRRFHHSESLVCWVVAAPKSQTLPLAQRGCLQALKMNGEIKEWAGAFKDRSHLEWAVCEPFSLLPVAQSCFYFFPMTPIHRLKEKKNLFATPD